MPISVLALKFRGEDQKKGFSAKSYALSWRSLVFFVLEGDFTNAWAGAQAVFGGGGTAEVYVGPCFSGRVRA